MGRIIRKTLAEITMTDESRARLEALAKRPDSEIDLTEMPELTEKFWQNAIPSPFYRPVKKQISVRIDADVLAWLQDQGAEGYQSRMNGLLRRLMLEDLRDKRKRA